MSTDSKRLQEEQTVPVEETTVTQPNPESGSERDTAVVSNKEEKEETFEQTEQQREERIEESTIFTKPSEKKVNEKEESPRLLLKLGIILLVVAILGIGTWMAYPKLTAESETTEATEPPTINATGTMDIKQVKITNAKDSYTVVGYEGTDDDGNATTLWKMEGLDHVPQSQYMYSMLIEAVQSVIANRIMEESNENLTEYGLDQPVTVLEITKKDGSVNVVKVGAQSPDQSGRYVTTTDKPKIYLVPSDRLDTFELVRTKYVETVVIPALKPMSDNDAYFRDGELVRYDSITLSGSLRKQPIVLEYSADSSAPILNQITSPVNTFAGDEQVSTLLSVLSSDFTSADAYVIDPTAADLKAYHLDQPQSIITWKVRDTTVTMKLSEHEEGYYAGLINDNPVIYKITKSTAEFFDWDLSDIRNTIMFAVNITDVTGLKVTTPKGSADFKISNHTSTDSDENTSIITSVTNNAAAIRSESFQNFYAYLVSIPALEYTDNARGSGKPEITLTYTYTNGKADTVAYYPYNDRLFRFTINGKGDALVQYSKVEAITSKFLDVLEGKDVTSD